MAKAQFDTLFATDGELSSFDFMVAQNAEYVENAVQTLLVRTKDGLKMLNPAGELVDTTGDFMPNCLQPMLNTEDAVKTQVYETLVEWLDDEEEAESLLRHLATCLSPGWSAVKYVLLLGEGRNGKGLLLKMLHGLFGRDNVSSVTRQQISVESPVVTELNGKLLNLVYDGQAAYLKDSGAEKTLIAGEPFPIRRLYESTPTMVQTSALFVESLNKEPKSGDKSSALQKRLVRFLFPNIYPLDLKFERMMLAEPMLGAFMALLIDRYVFEDNVAEMLMPTKKALELQLEHEFANSLALQFLKQEIENDILGIDVVLGVQMPLLVQKFQAWRINNNDLASWSEPDVEALFRPLFNTERKSVRTGADVRKVRVVTSLKSEAAAFVESLKGLEEEVDEPAVVED
jgi:hypothetical protein